MMIWFFTAWATVAQGGILEAKIRVNQVVPPPRPVPGLRALSVGRFSGPAGAALSTGLAAALVDPDRGPRDTRKPTIEEGLRVDVFSVVPAGGDAALTGSNEVVEGVEDFEMQVAKLDSEGKTLQDGAGNVVLETVNCRKRTVTLTSRFELKSKSGELLVAHAVSRVAADSKCGKELAQLPDVASLAERAAAGAAVDVVNTFAPRWQVVGIDLSKDKSVKDAFQLAKDERLDEALCAFRAVWAAEAYNVDAIYDLGAVYEAKGLLTSAAETYAKAVSATGDKNATDGLNRLTERKKDIEVLVSHYGQTYAPPSAAPTCPEGPAASGGRAIELKKATALLSSPELGAPPMAALPKALRLLVLEESGPVWKVRAPDGNEGWIDAKAAK